MRQFSRGGRGRWGRVPCPDGVGENCAWYYACCITTMKALSGRRVDVFCGLSRWVRCDRVVPVDRNSPLFPDCIG